MMAFHKSLVGIILASFQSDMCLKRLGQVLPSSQRLMVHPYTFLCWAIFTKGS